MKSAIGLLTIRRGLILGAVILMAAALGSVVYAASSSTPVIPAEDGSIHACYKTPSSGKKNDDDDGGSKKWKHGQVRLVGGADDCKKNETHITWSQVGPAGADGADGADGAAGPPGPPGATPDLCDLEMRIKDAVPKFAASSDCVTEAPTTWTGKTGMPTGRWGVAVAATNGKVYAIGGESLGFLIHSEVEAYDPAADSWITRASLSTARTEVAVAVGADGKIYVFGGNLNGGVSGFTTVTTLEVYDPASNSWTIKSPMTVRRSSATAATDSNGNMYVIGGLQTNNQLPVGTVEKYDPTSDTWTTMPDMPTARYNAIAVTAINGKIYVFGGHDTSQVFAIVDEYDPATDTWTSRTPMPTGRSAFGAVLGRDGKIYVFGGVPPGGGALSSVDVYDPAKDSWSSGPQMPATRYRFGAAKAENGNIYVIGGVYNDSESNTTHVDELK